MPSTRQVVAVLFADVESFSAIADDRLISEVTDHVKRFVDTQVSRSSCLYSNTWGDAIVLACLDPNDTLEYALRLRDWFTNHNWIRRGFPKPLRVRIGLHSEKVNVVHDGDGISGISGKNVNFAARIEPIVPPGSIYCSEAFHMLVKDEASGFVSFRDLGEQELAKGFGRTRLLQIVQGQERLLERPSASFPPIGVSLPKIRKEYTDAEKDAFLDSGFTLIRDYFRNASKALEQSDRDLKVHFRESSPTKFTCEVFVKGNKKAQCQVWLVKELYNNGILYSQTISSRDNSYNESLSVTSDGYGLFFRTMGMLSFFASAKESLSPEDAAHLLWNAFVKQLA